MLYPSFFAFTLLFVWLFQLRCRLIDLAERQRSRRDKPLLGKLGFVMAVTLITWIGIFAYLLTLDRSLRRLERQEKEQDEL